MREMYSEIRKERKNDMFCTTCGKELKEEWSICPYCGNETNDENEKKEKKEIIKTENTYNAEDEDVDLKSEIKLIKGLMYQHPVRIVLCIPIIIYMIYLLYLLFTYNFNNLLHGQNFWATLPMVIRDLIPIFTGLILSDIGLWLFYGPKNYKQVKENVTKKSQKGYGIASHILALIVALVLMSCASDGNEDVNYVERELSSEIANDEPSNNMTMEDYINLCQEVTGEDIARIPEAFVGKDIILEGEFDILAGEIVMNWFTDSGIIGIKYNGKAVDMQGNVIGNVMTGDYGYVAGRYEGEDDWGHKYINAQIIILDRAE